MNADKTSKISYYVTKICNNKGVTRRQISFLKKCILIQLELQRPFSSSNFPEIKPNCFRQRLHRLKDFIEVHVKSSCCYYRVKGVPLNNKETIVTDDPMGDKLFLMLMHVKEQPAAIHNIKIQFISNLHKFVSQIPNIRINSQNKGILLDLEPIPNYRTKILIYPNKIQVDIACTFNPIIYNIEGAFFLNSLLTLLHKRLVEIGRYQADIPVFNDWIITHYHFGRDGQEEWNSESFHITIKDALHQLIRYYSKLLPDKKRICRWEIAKSPQVSISEEMEKMSKQEMKTEFVN